jgi:SAM-dependent methyltransferase
MIEKPTPAGMYDYYLGGTTNTVADRAAAEQVRGRMPELYDAAWANRGFLQRAVRWLANQGIRQFMDIGAGYPTQNPTHEIAHRTDPQARVAYVDKDPHVQAKAEAVLADEPLAIAVTADLRKPDEVLDQVRELIDLDQPVALLMVAVLHFVPDKADPWGLVRQYAQALVPGSYLALSHITPDRHSEEAVGRVRDVYRDATEQIHLRTRAEVERFFVGLELIRPHARTYPEVTYVGLWGADDPEEADSDGSRWSYCGVARVPYELVAA